MPEQYIERVRLQAIKDFYSQRVMFESIGRWQVYPAHNFKPVANKFYYVSLRFDPSKDNGAYIAYETK